MNTSLDDEQLEIEDDRTLYRKTEGSYSQIIVVSLIFVTLLFTMHDSYAPSFPTNKGVVQGHPSPSLLKVTQGEFIQLKRDIKKAIDINQSSTSLEEWRETGYTPDDIFENAKALSNQNILCRVLLPLRPVELTLFENKILENFKKLECGKTLLSRLNHYWEANAERMTHLYESRPYIGDVKLGEIALVFDGALNPHYTEKILNTLSKLHVHAMFIVETDKADKNRETLRMILNRGHDLSIDLTIKNRGTKYFQKRGRYKVGRFRDSFFGETGEPLFFLNLNSTHTPEGLLELARKEGLGVSSWDWDSKDWKVQDPNLLLKNVMDELDEHAFGVLHMHDSLTQTHIALPYLVKQIRESGAKIVRVTEHKKGLALSRQK